MEFEAVGIAFHIDHYNPQREDKTLVALYSNLMWSCGTCNEGKTDYYPDEEFWKLGYIFFKADEHQFFDHFYADGYELGWLTPTGEFTVEMLRLNRDTLQRIRRIREELGHTQEAIVADVNALRKAQIDRLPSRSKGEAAVFRTRALQATDDVQGRIDDLVRQYASACMSDPDADVSETQAGRKALLEKLKALHPGKHLRARDKSKPA